MRVLAFANIRRNAPRTAGLALLAALLSFAVFAGALAGSSLMRGLENLQARLGADIIVAPDTAKSKVDLQEILLEGVPGQFYMDASYVSKIAQRDGVEQVSPQYYLATAKAGCCSFPVQIIGFDPDTDFAIQPWVARSYSHELGVRDVVTGCNISGAPGSSIRFYGVDCRIVARLDETGTSLDNAVFATNDTLRELIAGSQEQGIAVLADNDPNQVVSTVQVKVADGYRVQDVMDDINVHVRGVSAVQTRAMVSGVADGIMGVGRVLGVLVTALGLLAIVFLAVAFVLSARGRMREFAALRMSGASRSMLARMAVLESAIEGALGAFIGIALGLVVFYCFGPELEHALGLPFLLPGAGQAIGYALGTLVVGVGASIASSAFATVRLCRVDAGQVLREG